MSTGQRDAMRAAYNRVDGADPPRAQEGSDFLLGDTYRMAQHGDLPAHRTEQITSKIPDASDYIYNVKETKKDRDSYVTEVVHQERHAPTTWDAWKRQLQVFKTSLLMVIFCFPMQLKLQITKKELDKYYEFLLGPDIVGRDSQPSLKVMIQAERRAWRRIVLDLAEGTTLSEALKNMKQNTLFWQTEVLNKSSHQPADTEPWWTKKENTGGRKRLFNSKGRGKSKRTRTSDSGDWAWSNGQQGYDDYKNPAGKTPTGKGKGKGGKGTGKSKSKSKDKGKGRWASEDNKGRYYCWAFHQGKCSKGSNCPSSHRCPVVINRWGEGCNGKHMADEHGKFKHY